MPRRTLLLNIKTGTWDEELLKLFRIPRAMLPEVKENADDFGMTEPEIFGVSIPIRGSAGDQQAATIGQACFTPGMLKSTYGTGCFALLNTGKDMVKSKNRLLTTIAYRIDGETTYALEGAIFVAGASVQWMRDMLKLFENSADAGALAAKADPTQNVYLVPAFVGLGAPWWDTDARASHHRAHPQYRRGGTGAGGARIGELPDARPGRTRCARTGRARATRCCASMAAWWPRISPCSSSPTS